MPSRRTSEAPGLPANLYTSRSLARDLLASDVGQRLPTNAEFQEMLGVGSGTVQSSLLQITASGGATLEANGKRGTYLVQKNISKLWSLGEFGPVVGVFPLLVSGEWAGLATGLRAEFERIGVPLQTLHVHGSYLRMEMILEAKADFAVLSTEAAERITEGENEDAFEAVNLGPNTYYGVDSLIVMYRPDLSGDIHTSPKEPASVRRIGIDRTAYDHARLTQSEFPEEEGFTHVDVRYPYMPAAIVGEKLDAAVWNRQMLLLPLESVGIPVRALRRAESIDARNAMNSASLVFSRRGEKSGALSAVFGAVDTAKVSSVQANVREEHIMPAY